MMKVAYIISRRLRVRAARCGLQGWRGRGGRERGVPAGGGRRARELGRRWPAEVRAIKGGAGRRGGRSRRGGWGARSGSPRPPRRPARALLALGGAAQSGRWPRPRPAPSPGSPFPAAAAPAPGPAASEAGEREVRATTAPPRAWAEPSAGGAWAQPGDGREPQPPPASEPRPAPAQRPRPAPPQRQVRRRRTAGRAAPPRSSALLGSHHRGERGKKRHRRDASTRPWCRAG